MEEVTEVKVVAGKGLEGCIHGRPGSNRQVLIMDSETLGRLRVLPGAVKENITTRGIDFTALGTAQRLRIGSVLLELTAPCHPCPRMDELRLGLQAELRGQRGWLCQVLEGGQLRRGDSIELERKAQMARVGELV